MPLTTKTLLAKKSKQRQRKKEPLIQKYELCGQNREREQKIEHPDQEREQREQRATQRGLEREWREQKRAMSEQEGEHLEREEEPLTYAERLETFDQWPADHPVSPQVLAEAGFYWTRVDDEVECDVCRIMLYNMEAGDDLWVHHASRYPPCNFVKKKKGTSFIKKHQIMDFGSGGGKPLTISALLKYCSVAGLRIDYTKLVIGCVTYKDRTDKLLALLHEAGLEGEPNMRKCKALKAKRKREEIEQRRQEREQSEPERKQSGLEREQRGPERGQGGQEREQRGQEGEHRGQERKERGPEGEQGGLEREQRGPERGQGGQEREQRGQEGEQRGQERKERGPEREQGGLEREQRGPEREQGGLEREQRGPERGQGGQEREQREPERGQGGQEREQREPDRGQGGQEREQRGPERGQGGPEREQREPERGQGGQEREQREPERGQSGQEREQREPERGQGGQEREQREPDRGQGGQEREQRGPERGQGGQKRERRKTVLWQGEPERGQHGRNNQANRGGIVQVKKSRPRPKLSNHGVQNDDFILLQDIVVVARYCNEITRQPFLNIVANLVHGSGDLLKRRADEIKTVPDKKAKLFCEECGKCYTSKHFLQKHIISQHDLRCETCEECGEIFDTPSSFSKHRNTCGKSSSKHAQCNKRNCSECFPKNHIKSQQEIEDSDQNISICNKCGEMFAFEISLKNHEKTCVKDAVPRNPPASGVARSAPPERWCSEVGAYRNENREERSPMKADSVQQTDTQLVGMPGSSGIKSNQNRCKLCFSEGPFDIEKHYSREHNVRDPSSILCTDRTFLVSTTKTAAKHLGDDVWFCNQFSKAMERYTDTMCRLCDRDLTRLIASLGLKDLRDHYVMYHEVDRDLLCVTKRLIREDGVIVVEEAETSRNLPE